LSQIERIRGKIDEIDVNILKLLEKRIKLSKQLGAIKKKAGTPIHDRARERQILLNVIKQASQAGISPSEVESIFREIIAACRRAQGEQFSVAYLGPRGTFCEQAARAFFKNVNVSLVECLSIADVFRAVSVGETNYGVVPVENSTEGSVDITLDLLFESSLRICGEIEQQIRHSLIVKSGTRRDEIKTVLSHPQAIAQCRKFLTENLPRAKVREVSSTAAAIKMAKRMKNAAAIGPELAAKIYGMDVEANGIEDNPKNFTRFLVLSQRDAEPSGNDKTSIIFSVKHIPGALYSALEAFAKRQINLTKIESRPNRQKPWEYMFFCDFEGHRSEKRCQEALEDLKTKCVLLKMLGSYPKAS
jgi:chorismate mutase/prephenate dehydratase